MNLLLKLVRWSELVVVSDKVHHNPNKVVKDPWKTMWDSKGKAETAKAEAKDYKGFAAPSAVVCSPANSSKSKGQPPNSQTHECDPKRAEAQLRPNACTSSKKLSLLENILCWVGVQAHEH